MATLASAVNDVNLDGEIVAIDPELRAIFGAPRSHGESDEEYDCMWRRDRCAHQAQKRHRRGFSSQSRRSELGNSAMQKDGSGTHGCGVSRGLARVLSCFIPDLELRRDMVKRWVAGDPLAKEKVAKLLEPSSLGHNAIEAEAFAGRLATFDRLDQILTRLEVRRNSVLREIDRHREVLGRRAREALADVIDIEPEPPRKSRGRHSDISRKDPGQPTERPTQHRATVSIGKTACGKERS